MPEASTACRDVVVQEFFGYSRLPELAVIYVAIRSKSNRTEANAGHVASEKTRTRNIINNCLIYTRHLPSHSLHTETSDAIPNKSCNTLSLNVERRAGHDSLRVGLQLLPFLQPVLLRTSKSRQDRPLTASPVITQLCGVWTIIS